MEKLKRIPPVVWAVLLIVVVSGLAYLPLAAQFSFHSDDWYLIPSAHNQGVEKFVPIFASDRPARAILVGWVYSMFGDHPYPYSLSGVFLRILGALGVYWLLRLFWRRQVLAPLGAALLFAVYPGFLNMPNPFDYQSHLAAMALAAFSLALSLQALSLRGRRGLQVLLMLLALGMEFAYPMLMEYYIGLEGLRLALIVCLFLRRTQGGWARRLGRGLLAALPYLLMAGAFLYWRVMVFDVSGNTRSATDIGAMFANISESVLRWAWIGVYTLQGYLNTLLFAWAVPAYNLSFDLRLREFLTALGLALAGGGLTLAVLWVQGRVEEEHGLEEDAEPGWKDALWVGSLGILFGLLPVALGDRYVNFAAYSRFTLPPSLGAAFVWGALFSLPRRRLFNLGAPALLAALAVLTHYGNSALFAAQGADLRSFWWQMAWRAPSLKEGTVIVAYYPVMPITEDYFVWGPANLLYYHEPEPLNSDALKLSGVVLNRETTLQIQGGDTARRKRRSLLTESDFRNTLVLSRPSAGACVHVIDGALPELTGLEPDRIQKVAAYSRMGRIDTQAAPAEVLELAFGPEPAHDWCYYYEKAALAVQVKDWAQAARLAEEALEKKLNARDLTEWYPLALGLAYGGKLDALETVDRELKANAAARTVICNALSAPKAPGWKAAPEAHQQLLDALCQ